MNTKLESYYSNNESSLDALWEDHLLSNDWGSGEDKITITDNMFWEFVEDQYDKEA